MKYLCRFEDFVRERKISQQKCVELLGGGKFSIEEIEKIIEILENTNIALRQNCKTLIATETMTCGGTKSMTRISTITQSKLYQDNQFLIASLSMVVDIAKANNLKFVYDFNFKENEIINYCNIKK